MGDGGVSIRITKTGEHPDLKIYKGQCHRCRSVMEWQRKDARYVHSGDARSGPFTQINCPVCGNNVSGYP